MRVRNQGDVLSVFAVAGTNVVLLGLDMKEHALENLLGFAIHRHDHEREDDRWLRGGRAFKADADKLTDASLDSRTAPIQSFLWGDYTANAGATYTYSVEPVYGEPGALERGDGVDVTVTVEREDDMEHAVFFNRGVAGSQAYSRRFGEYQRWYKVERFGRGTWMPFIKPDIVPGHQAWRWLSRGLEEAVLAYIAQADSDRYALRASVYEFNYLPVVQAFVDAIDRGVDVKVIYDARQSGKDKKGPWKETVETFRQVAVRNQEAMQCVDEMLVPRTKATISHNKFIVLLKDGEPIQVWTGSVNFTLGGIFGQSNVGHVVRDAEVSRRYLSYWEALSEDPTRAQLSNWNIEQEPDLESSPDAGTITPIFSPRPTTAMLDWYADQFGNAEQSVHLTAAFGVSAEIAKKLVKRNGHSDLLRYLMMESIPSRKASQKRKRQAREKGRPVPRDYYDFVKVKANRISVGATLSPKAWSVHEVERIEEYLSGLDQHVDFLHTKFMLIDPLSEDPTVITGSANFSAPSTTKNDENMLVIRGNTRVADIFLGEFMRLFNHFRPRFLLNQMTAEETEQVLYLSDDESWTSPYYEEGTQEFKERILFA